ncbi:DUF3987 domain-containing protein [Gemmata sp.]|uniref:DUF3987 domain-containing protein n=1 Tax=Gemmata sp. TaxID=1914242 RepID=UPI003F7036E9
MTTLDEKRRLVRLAAVPARNGTHADAPKPPPPAAAVPEYRPFPVEVLPTVLRAFVTEAAAAVGCDPVYAALPALVVTGAAAGAAVVVSPKRRYREPPAIWGAVIGDSGTGKSPGMAPAVDAVFGIDRGLKKAHAEALTRYEADLKAWEADRDAGDRPAKPGREYLVAVDTTIERLAEMLGDSPRGLVLVRDELAGWFSSFVRYKSGRGATDLPNWLSMFDAGAIRVNRRTGEPRDVETDRSFVAVLGGVQPDVLREILSDSGFTSSGLAARLLFAAPPKACPKWTDDELNERTEEAFGRTLTRLRGIPFSAATGPAVVHLDSAALNRFKRLNDEFAERAEGIDGGPLAAALPKAVRYALRLALVHHLARRAPTEPDPHAGPLLDVSMAAGEELARWFVHEAERVYQMLAESAADRASRSLAELVRRKGGRLTPRDLQRTNPGKYRSAELAELALDALVSAGAGEWVVGPSGPKGGRPARTFVARVPQEDNGDDDRERSAIAELGGG